jgi:uncharacterized protein YggT (Ycf19 family)
MQPPDRDVYERRDYDPARREVREERYEEHHHPGAPPVYDDAPLPPYNLRAVQVTWFLIGLITALIAIRFLLKALGASSQAQFVAFVYGVTGPLVAPFQGIFPTSAQGYYILEPSSLIAIVIYLLIGWAIVTLIKIATAPRGRRTLY